jgi:hypothetical protein
LQDDVERLFRDESHGRIIPFDAATAFDLSEDRGQPHAYWRANVALPRSHCLDMPITGATLATRNEKHFEDYGLAVLNPLARLLIQNRMKGPMNQCLRLDFRRANHVDVRLDG